MQYSVARAGCSLQRSTRHVEDRVRLFELLSQDLDSFDCRKNKQFDLVMLRLAFHFFHHRQSAECTSTDDELAAFPRYVLRDGQWRMPKVIAEFLGRLLLAVADLPAVDDHIVLKGSAVDAEKPKEKLPKRMSGLLAAKDGVTNSSPRLGQVQLIRRGHKCLIASLSDFGVGSLG